MPFSNREEQRAYQRRWVAKRRAAFFDNKVCVDCGSTESLELDHLDSDQKVDHKIWSWSEERRMTEAAKCVVRCQRCHSERHHEPRRKHGIGRYQAGCRCNICRAAKAVCTSRETRRQRKGNPMVGDGTPLERVRAAG